MVENADWTAGFDSLGFSGRKDVSLTEKSG
jgi:hypothetical protein